MAKFVNLDAMIRREDLDVTDKDPPQLRTTMELKILDLEESSASFNILRKPDFQRETANWTGEKIADLIQNFLDGDLIPSVVVWRSNKSGKLFVIDGAHRLSALIAWINDDYGDQNLSNSFFGHQIEDSQKAIAVKTRNLIASRIGTYENLKKHVKNPDGAPDGVSLMRSRNMGSLGITLQDVRGDVGNAERSFLKINQSATPIHPTELIIIQARRKANAIAARALLRAGTGHPYWSAFEEEAKQKITALAREIYENLFKPLLETPIRTLELPAAGQALSPDSLGIVFLLVNYINSVSDSSSKKNSGTWKYKPNGKDEVDLIDDGNGEMTISFLEAVKSSTSKVFGPAKGSLALHSSVYCYGATGRFQPTAFLAAIAFVQDLELHRKFDFFTAKRAKFEDFLINYRHFVNQIIRSYGSQVRGLSALLKMYKIVLTNIGKMTDKEIVELIIADKELSFVSEISDDDRTHGRNFSRETSDSIFLKQAMAKALTCGICGARINTKISG